MALEPFIGPRQLFSFLILYTDGTTPWTGDQPVARSLPTNRTTQTRNKSKQTSKPRVGFEPMSSAFERAKTVHALECAAAVMGRKYLYRNNKVYNLISDINYKLIMFETRPLSLSLSLSLFLSSHKNELQEPRCKLIFGGQTHFQGTSSKFWNWTEMALITGLAPSLPQHEQHVMGTTVLEHVTGCQP
jgi:hypothetical protein